jgi:ribosome-binding factor A
MKRHDEGAGFRHARLQRVLFEELQSLLSDEVSDPDLQDVAMVAVVLSVDYRHARVHFSVRGPEEVVRARRRAIEEALRRATPFLRRRLADSVELKVVPDLRFVFDAATAEGASE